MDIKPEEIAKISREVGVRIELLEKHMKVLELACRIQAHEEKLILFGGTAAQFYLSKEVQRTSRDVDLITRLGAKEVDESIQEFCAENPDIKPPKKDRMKKVYGTRYLFPISLAFTRDPKPQSITVEIVSRKNEELRSLKIKGCKLYDHICGDFNLLKKEDLLAKKFVPLDLKRFGIERDQTTEIAKQIYDIKRLYDTLRKDDYGLVGGTVYAQIQNEINHRKISCSPDDCITTICNGLSSLGLVDIGKNGNDDIKFFLDGWRGIGTISPNSARFSIPEWGALGWDFEHFIKSIQTDYHNNNNERVLAHFALRDEYSGEDKEKSELKAGLIADLKKYGYTRHLKGRPLISLIYAKELHETFGKKGI